MPQRSNQIVPWLIACTAAMLLFIGSIGFAQFGGRPPQPPLLVDQEFVFPRTRLLTLDGHVMRLDTATGEMNRFSGHLMGPAARGNWIRFAPPVREHTSGFLEVRRQQNGTFLIDAATGDTWILRQRGSIGNWVPLRVLTERS
jgi:hypothetical protein